MDKLTQAGPAAAPKTVAQVLGEMVWLMSQSAVHKQLFIGDLEWFCMPPVLLEQFRIYNGPTSPTAFALWAFVSEETEQRLVAGGHKLRPDEWRSGERAWLIEVVAPQGGENEILQDLATHIFGGKPFKFHTMTAAGERKVDTFPATSAALQS